MWESFSLSSISNMAKQAISVSQLLAQKKETLVLSPEFRLAFGEPEAVGTWLVWGNSGNGKTSFALLLAKELCQHGTVIYNSLEEGTSLTLMNAVERCGLAEVNRRVQFVSEDIETFQARLERRRSPKIAFIDSFQFTDMTYKRYLRFKEALPKHLLVFISHADGNFPAGRSARSVMYDASLKIWVEGHRAHSKGRFIGERGWVNVWDEGARRYWGDTVLGN